MTIRVVTEKITNPVRKRIEETFTTSLNNQQVFVK